MIIALKFFIRRLLCNDFTGSLIRKWFKNSVPDVRWKGYKFQLPEKGVSNANVAALFFGFYESAEIRLIQKYMNGSGDVVELGASLGVVTGHIVSKLNSGARVISVEANPYLIENINTNVGRYAKNGVAGKTLNVAVQYHVDEVIINISDNNTESSVSRKQDLPTGVKVKAMTLQNILEKENINDFTLVCDIEGSEIEIVLFDETALKHCKKLFIELHSTNYEGKKFEPADILAKLISDHGFKLVEQQGPVYYMQK